MTIGLICFVFLAPIGGWGQVQVTVNVLPPYSAYLQDYPGRGNQVQIFVRNTTNAPLDVRFLGNITGDNGVVISTPVHFRPLVPLRLGPLENRLLSRNDLEGLFDLGQIEVQGIDKAQLYRGLPLPEGSYQLCVRAFDNRSSRPLSPEFPLGCSSPFMVRSVEPPIIINPVCDSKIVPNTPQNVIFSWTPPVGMSPAQVQYTLRVIELPDVQPVAENVLNNQSNVISGFPTGGQDKKPASTTKKVAIETTPTKIISSNLPLGFDPNVFIDAVVLPPSGVEVRNLRVNSFLYGPSQPALKVGKRYAVRVQAIDLTRKINFLNEGKSPVCYFIYGEEAVPFFPLGPSFASKDTTGTKVMMAKSGNLPVKCTSCSANEISNKQVDNAGVLKSKSATIGLFTMQLLDNVKEINGNLNGDGMIPIPMVNSQYVKLRVRLYDVQCNSAGQVISGIVRARLSSKANPSLFPNYDSPDYKPPTLTSDQMGSLSDFFTNQKDMLVSSLMNAKESIGFEVPFGIDKSFGPVNTVIAITNVTFTPINAYFDANTWIKVANGQVNGIPLSGYNMCISPEKPCGEGILYLAEKMKLSEFFALKGMEAGPPKGPFEGPDTTQVTHVVFDETGFKQMRVHGLITPPGLVNDNTKGPVEISVNAGMVNFQNWTAQLSFPKFYVEGLPDFKFSMLPGKPANYDHSESETLAKLPEGYLENPTVEFKLWQGLYFPEINLELPAFIKRADGKPLTVGVSDLISDNNGFSGKAFVKNILDVGSGSLDSWYYSVDELSVSFLKSKFQKSQMKGLVVLPIFKNPQDQASQLPYTCTLSKDPQAGSLGVEFSISPTDEMQMDIWKAQLHLANDSKIFITYNTQGFTAGAELNGKLDIVTDYFNFTAASFQGLKFQTKPDYFGLTSLKMGSASPQKAMADFPLTLTDYKLVNNGGGSMGLKLIGKLDLTGDGPTGLSATGGATILFNVGMSKGRPDWSFDKIQPDSIAVDCDLGPVHVQGSLAFFNNHATYGNGLAGEVDMTVAGLIGGKVLAQFGRTLANNGNFRYWHVGGKIKIGASGIPFAPPSPLVFRSFGGGLYSNMTKVFNEDGSITYTPKVLPAPSGGFEATVGIGLVTPDVFTMEGTMTIQSDAIAIDVKAWLLGEDTNKSLAQGSGNISYDFKHSIFKAQLNMHAGYSVPLLSISANIEDTRLLIDGKSGNWFLSLGVPQNRIGLDITLAKLGKFNFGSYFMMGNYTPDFVGSLPPAPYGFENRPGILEELGYKGSAGNAFKGDSPMLAFGVGYQLKADFGLGPFHLRYDGAIGFDLALAKSEDQCNGNTPGINGWYAQGQIYAYMHFALDLDIDTWVYEGTFTVVELEAAALLRGGMVNPIWLNGHVLLKYRVLGGLVKGRVNLEFWYNKGERCEPAYSPPNPFAGQPLIASLGPSGTDKKVSILSPYYAEFNYPVETNLIIDIEIPQGQKVETSAQGTITTGPGGVQIFHREFQLKLKEFGLKEKFNTVAVTFPAEYADCSKDNSGRFSWGKNEDGDPNYSATYYRSTALLPNSTYKLSMGVQVFIKDNSGKPVPYIFKEQTVEQTETVEFATGPCMSVLAKGSDDNATVLTSYPYEGQRYFMKGDPAATFIILKANLSCCMKNLNSDDTYDLKARFVPLEGAKFAEVTSLSVLLADAKFDGDKVSYKMPFGIKNKTFYRFELVRIPKADFAEKMYAEAQKAKASAKKITSANIYVSAKGAAGSVSAQSWSNSGKFTAPGMGAGAMANAVNQKYDNQMTSYTVVSEQEYEKIAKGYGTTYKINTGTEKMFNDGKFVVQKFADALQQQQKEEAAFYQNLESRLYKYYFKTSEFSTLKEKLNAAQFPPTETNFWGFLSDALTTKMVSKEGFDTYELTTEKLSSEVVRPPLVLLRADPTSNWFKNIAVPVSQLLELVRPDIYDTKGTNKLFSGSYGKENPDSPSKIFERAMVFFNTMNDAPQPPFKNEDIEALIPSEKKKK
ncbi:hypothetical protein [Runella sp.]|uniref:hypothetical protein n=1 Tax=Runella sp. TaxID=1960881 RepID=UPI003D141285